MRWQKPALHSPWPRRSHAWLLRAAHGDARALAEWERDADLGRLDHASLVLVPLLYRATGSERYRGVYQWSWYRNALLFRALRTALAALDAAAIPSLVLKGAALSVTAYRDRGARHMGDADVLVPAARAAEAVERLREAGFVPREPLNPAVFRERHSIPLFDAQGRSLDLHWYALADEVLPDGDAAFFARAIPIAIDGAATRTLAPEDHLLLVIGHGFIANANTVAVQWVSDALALLRTAEAFDWARLIDSAEARGLLLIVRNALAHLRAEYGAPVPEEALARMQAQTIGRAERIEYWFKVRDVARTPTGSLPLLWFGYSRVCRRTARRRTPVGFVRYVRDLQSLATGGFVLRALLWPVRQLYWFATSIGRRERWLGSASTHRPS